MRDAFTKQETAMNAHEYLAYKAKQKSQHRLYMFVVIFSMLAIAGVML